ncbi:MAG TPA: flagellar hook-length control protein FliK [Rhabdaerophilum sp.]|nr:flagellar hook-length control protein FliK [Rhabdaerophilum sp.]
MPSEASFSLIRSINEMTTTRRTEPGRPENDGENARPENFGSLVSEAAQARNAERRNVPPVEALQQPVDPRPAAERRQAAETRAERANPRRSEEGDARYNEEKAPPTAAKPDKTETAGGADETPACKDGCKEEKAEGEAAVVEAAGETLVVEPVKTDVAPTLTVPAAISVSTPLSGETTPPAVVAEGSDLTSVGNIDKTGGMMAPEAETPVPVVAAAAEETAGALVAKAETGKTASTDDAVSETPATSATETGDGVVAELTARTTAAGTKEAGGKTDTAVEKVKTGTEESESANEKTAEAGKKTVTPDLNPTRLNRVADMLESFGLSHAIHRPADILAGLDRAVQASAMNSALNRGTEVARPTPLQMLPIEIGMQAVRGVTNFQIRLDPAELGRVDVKLQIRDNGEVNASLVVDRVETLAMLKRDASTLQQAFEQAGLRQSADGLSFSLRGEGQNGEARREGARGPAGEHADDNTLQPQVAEMAMRRAYVPNSNLDLMI